MQKSDFAIILNPESGSHSEEMVRKVREALENSQRPFICLETDPDEGAKPAVQKAAESGVHTVIVCGGDGTVMSAVNAIGKAQADIKLAIVPGGTANLLARALGVPLDAEDAMEVALEGADRHIDLGECGDTLFALGLGLGLTEKLVSGASSEEKERLGKWAYAKALLEEVGAKPSTFTYTLDDGQEQTTQGVAVIVANAGTLSGNIEFAPGAQMDDGQLDLVILHRLHARDLVRLVAKSLFGTQKTDRTLTCVAGNTIHINSNPPLDLQIDGEKVKSQPPLHIEVRPGALRVAVPNEKQKASLAAALKEKLAQPVNENAYNPMWRKLATLATISAISATIIWKICKRR